MTKVLLTESYLDDIADAIREKRGVLTEYKPSQMAGAIMDIDTHDTHDATASAGDVLTGKTAYIATGKVSGTMPNQGAIAGTIDAENPSYTVPEGYHSGLGTVSADVATTAEVEAYVGRIKKLVPKNITENGTYDAEDDNVGGYSQVTVNVRGEVVQGFELYAATFDGGTQNFPQGVFDNKYFVCCFHDNMDNQYTLNGVSGNYSANEPGKNSGYIRATTLAVTNQQTTQVEALLTAKGSVFISYHNDSGSYISVAGGWVGYPTGGTIYESVATGTTNAITMNSAHSRLLIFFAASNTGLSSVSTIDVNGVTHSVVNMGTRYDSVYSLYTAIEINNNSDTTITITMPESCYSYLSIIGI